MKKETGYLDKHTLSADETTIAEYIDMIREGYTVKPEKLVEIVIVLDNYCKALEYDNEK